MVKFSEKNLLRHYFGFSFYSASFLWISFFTMWGSDFWNTSFFASLLVVGSAFCYFRGINYLMNIDSFAAKRLPFYFLFQSVAFVGMSIETSTTGIMYFTLFPSITYVLTVRHENDRKKGVALFGICIGTYIVFSAMVGKQSIGLNEILFLFFGIFSLGLLYFASVSSNGKNFLATFFGGSWTGSDYTREYKKEDRLFFHDLVNQTHGVTLFLNHKLALKQGVAVDEVNTILKEVNLIQSLIKDHYGLVHKNLTNLHNSISFGQLRSNLESIMNTYLYPGHVKYRANYTGRFENDFDICNIHYPALVRIVTNLVKNVAESGSDEVFFNFDYHEQGLKFIMKNRIFNMHEDKQSVNEDIQRIILSIDGRKVKSDEEKLGLESVSYLIETLGGYFNFAIEGEYWVAEVFLPDEFDSLQEVA